LSEGEATLYNLNASNIRRYESQRYPEHPWEKKERKKERMLLLNKSPTEGGNADIYTNNTWQSAWAILLLKRHILLIVRVC
jgi:hypothetical protein